MWIEHLGLNEFDKENLLHPTGWLTDNIMNAAQQLLRKQFPDLLGLQSVILGQTMSFKIQSGEFLQILHSVNHWVTVSTLSSENSSIKLYDSHYTGIPSLLEAQIATLLCTDRDQVEVEIQNVQSQVRVNVH